jgi:ferredoxin
MVLIRHGERTIELRPGETVLDGLLRSGAYFPYHCRSGSCHTCIAQATAGSPPPLAQGDLTSAERAEGYFLACVAVPETDLVVRAVY